MLRASCGRRRVGLRPADELDGQIVGRDIRVPHEKSFGRLEELLGTANPGL